MTYWYLRDLDLFIPLLSWLFYITDFVRYAYLFISYFHGTSITVELGFFVKENKQFYKMTWPKKGSAISNIKIVIIFGLRTPCELRLKSYIQVVHLAIAYIIVLHCITVLYFGWYCALVIFVRGVYTLLLRFILI